jgi:enamine deaminase RidA (YjgF/YER057c/UK114 family)
MRLLASLVLAATVVTVALAQSPKQIIRTGPDRGTEPLFSPAVKAGGLIYASGMASTTPKDDIKAQTKQTLDTIDKTLKAAGSSLANAANVTVYLTDAANYAAMNEAYRASWPKDPPARTCVVTTLAPTNALVEISVIAVPDGTERVVVNPPGWNAAANPYSYGIRTGNTLFMAGLVSRSGVDNSAVKGDITAQMKQALDNGAEILKTAGMSYADVVSSRLFLTDAANFSGMNATYRPYFPSPPPARATVIAGLPGADYLIEVSMIAVKDPSRRAIVPPKADGTPGTVSPTAILSSAISVGNRLYVSGVLPGNAKDNKGDVKAQTTDALASIERTLKLAGFALTDVVDVVMFVPDLSARFADMNAAYTQVFLKERPARVSAGVGLVMDAVVEIMVTAVK